MTEQIENNQSEINKSVSPTSPTPPKKTRQKTITLSDLKKQAKKIDEYSIYVVNKERNEIIKYNESFSEVKIEQLITELYSHILYDSEKELGFFNNTQVFVTYVNFLIIKYFTNLNTILSDSLEENISTIEELRKLQIFKVLFDEIFDNNEVAKVFDAIYSLIDNADKLNQLDKNQLEELIEVTQTPFLKDKLTAKLHNQTVN